ncbi:hypothetical protein [Sphingomonas sp. Leaf37]|uniref:hypothetical protein n=1 Tax=Sphingomonas sp. Leaf37 TaxID=2876552 RepID=UPI001E4675DA|nr:hypothetical protein [Sphingomonas sp. Leaf37]
MATRALSIIVPDAATPAPLFVLPTPTNDNLRSWTDDRRAKLLLASCASSMPLGEWNRAYHAYGYGEGFRYIGYRVDALTAIRDEHGQRALDLYHAEGDPAYAVFAMHCQSASVTDAIDAAAEAALAAKMEG